MPCDYRCTNAFSQKIYFEALNYILDIIGEQKGKLTKPSTVQHMSTLSLYRLPPQLTPMSLAIVEQFEKSYAEENCRDCRL